MKEVLAFLSTEFGNLGVEIVYICLALLFLYLGKQTLDALTPFQVNDELTAKDNPAFGLSLLGYYLGIMIVFLGAIHGHSDSDEPWVQVGIDMGWVVLGILLLNVSRVVMDRLILHKFSTRKEIIEDRNVGMGAVEFGMYVGSGLLLAGAISGPDGHFLPALVFFVLGQLALIAISWLYQRITSYDFHAEIEKDNVAAGIAFGGNCLAASVVLMKGTIGDFHSWKSDLLHFGWYFICALLLITIGRLAICRVLVSGRTLDQEISEDQNLNAGWLEGGLVVGLATLFHFVL